jgi:hypothetical protein
MGGHLAPRANIVVGGVDACGIRPPGAQERSNQFDHRRLPHWVTLGLRLRPGLANEISPNAASAMKNIETMIGR